MKTFFTSDTHFGHANIIKYCKRPFNTSKGMDETLISNWNSKISNEDVVYHLGDFAFAPLEYTEELISRLNGNIFLIMGNHDKQIRKTASLKNRFEECVEYKEIYIQHNGEKQAIIMSHYPMLVWNKSHHSSWMLHGHSHGTLKYPFNGKIMDVGVDPNSLMPLSFEQIERKMKAKPIASLDHH